MIFWVLTPVPPPHLGTPFLGGGVGGSKLLCVLWPLCVYLDVGPEELLSCIWTPYPIAGVPGPNSRYPSWLPPYGPLAVRTLPFSRCIGCLEHVKNFWNSRFHEYLPLPLGWVWVIIW